MLAGYAAGCSSVYRGMHAPNHSFAQIPSFTHSARTNQRTASPPVRAQALAELIAAVGDDDATAVRRLIDEGAPVWARNLHGQSALACAASHGNSELVDLLLSVGADARGLGVNGHPVLSLAASTGRADIVRRLLCAGALPDGARSLTGETALHVAAAFDRVAVAGVLIAAGATIDAHTQAEVETDLFPGRHEVCEETALHRAAEAGSRELIELLLAYGADRMARAMLGETPQAWARRARRSSEIIALLAPSWD
jgi:uncharacterized protein